MPRLRRFPATLTSRSLALLAAATLWFCGSSALWQLAQAAERLPLDIVPLSQSVSLRLDPEISHYSGSTRISIEVRQETDAIEFNAEGVRITAGRIKPAEPSAGSRTPAEGFLLDVKLLADGRARATLREQLVRPGHYELKLDFERDYGTQGVGLYRMTQGARSYLFTQFEEEDAREAFPCWDEPSFKIPFLFTISAPDSETVVFNTPVASESVEAGWRTLSFEPTPPLPTYLLAIAVGRLDRIPIPGMSVPGALYLLPGQRELAELAVEMTPPLLAELERYFGEPYPFAKCDFIAVPEFWAGAMENPGAITFNARLLLIDKKTAGVGQTSYLAWTLAHEMAHIWFGDLVTMRWWDDLWLNESFADWLGIRVTNAVYPELRILSEELSYNADVMSTDAQPTSQAIRAPVENIEELLQNLDVQYDKGRAVLGMFEQWLGRDRFREGVLLYLARNRWGNATSDDLWAALHAVTEQDVPGAMRTFLEQPGLPLVTLERLATHRVRLAQSRYTAAGVAQPPLLWRFPVTLRFADAIGVHTQTVFLTQPTQEVRLAATGPVTWIHPNADASGYYRWSLPDSLLAPLLDAAEAQLSERERVALASDLESMVGAGRFGGAAFLRATEKLAASSDPRVVIAALEELDRVRDALVPEALVEPFARYVRRALRPAYERWGAAPFESLSTDARYLRPQLFAWLGDHGRDPEVQRRMTELADRYMVAPDSVEAAEAAVALRVSAYDGDAARFVKYRRAFEAARDPSERVLYLRALGSFRRPALRDSALAYSLAGPLRSTETFEIPRMVRRDPAARDQLLDWAMVNYDTLAARVPASFLTRIADFAGGCSAERLERAQVFLGEPGRQIGGMEIALAKVAEEVAACLRLRTREGERVQHYLTDSK